MAIVNTIYGEMDDAALEKREGTIDNDNETTTWVEYWLKDELVHRSAHVNLKPSAATLAGSAIGSFA